METSAPSTENEQGLDLASIVKASQALSREVHLDRLLKNLMRIIMENAGGTKALFMVNQNDDLLIMARVDVIKDEIDILAGLPVKDSKEVPLSVLNYSARTQTNVVLSDPLNTKNFHSDPYIQSWHPMSILSMPVRHLGKLSGLLYLENNLIAGAFTPQKVQLIELLAAQTAISLENVSVYETLETKVKERTEQLNDAVSALWGEMELAKKIQTVLLPDKPEVTGFEICASLVPAEEVGGDYYDVISAGDYDWIIIGDVTGHGVTAGLIMMMVQTAIHTLIIENPGMSPSTLLAAVNKTIFENIQRLNESKHMTIVALKSDRQGCFTFSGRHDDILVLRAKTKTVETYPTDGIWLGLIPDVSTFLKESELKLEPGDFIILYTDGITEARDAETDELYGGDRLIESIQNIEASSADQLHQGILENLNPYLKKDDVALVVLKRC